MGIVHRIGNGKGTTKNNASGSIGYGNRAYTGRFGLCKTNTFCKRI